jgi:hypothetical protein
MFGRAVPALALLALVSCGGALPRADSGLPPPGEPIELVAWDAFPVSPYIVQINGIALSEDYVNFTVEYYGVYRVPKYGGETAAIRAEVGGWFGNVVATRNTVVWTEQAPDRAGAFKMMRKTGDEAPVTLAELSLSGSDYISRAQISGDVVYMHVMSSVMRGIFSVPLAGGEVKFVADVQGALADAPSWRVADGYIYYGLFYGADASSNCLLSRVNVAGGTPEVLSQQCDGPADVLEIGPVDESNVYLVGMREIWVVPKQGGAPARSHAVTGSLIFGSAPGDAIQVDARKLYTVIFDQQPPYAGDSVAWMPKSGGDATTIAHVALYHPPAYHQLLQDDYALFVRTPDHIVVLPKPELSTP